MLYKQSTDIPPSFEKELQNMLADAFDVLKNTYTVAYVQNFT